MTVENGQRPTPQEIVVVHKAEPPGRSSWDSIERITKLLSLIAIPVVVALMGSLIQSSLGRRGLDRDYVQLAVTILTEPESDPALKRWAGQLLADHAPTPLSPEVLLSFIEGNLLLPRSYGATNLGIVQELQARELEGPIRADMRIERLYSLASTPSGSQCFDVIEVSAYTITPLESDGKVRLPLSVSMTPLPGVANEELFSVEEVRINGEIRPIPSMTITQESGSSVVFSGTDEFPHKEGPVQVAIRTRSYVPLGEDWICWFSCLTRDVSLRIAYPESLHAPRLIVFASESQNRGVADAAEMTPGRVSWDFSGWFMRGEGWILAW